MKDCKTFEELMLKLQQLESEEPSNIGKYTGKSLKPPIDFFENDCSKVKNYYHICGKKDNDSEVCKNYENDKLDSDPFEIDNDYNSENDELDKLNDLDDRGNMYIESESEMMKVRNLEYVTSNIMFVFERFSKNKLIDSFRKDVMFVLDKVNNLQEQNQILQGQLDESKLKMQKVSKKSSEIIRRLQAENDEVVKDKIAIIQPLEIEKEQLAEIIHMQSEEIATLTSQLKESRKMVTRKIAESDEIIIAYHKRIKEESALRQKFKDSTNQLNEILSQ